MFSLNYKPCAAAALLLALTGCGFIDLRPINCNPFPEKQGTILPSEKTPVGIRFNTAMDRFVTEKAFSVSAGSARIKGDLSWMDGGLSFVPVEGWRPGVRYMLALSGTILALDGRETQADLHIPFFAISAVELPLLTAFSPEDGASVGVNPEEGALLVLRFSVPMNRRSTEDALSVDGVSEREYRWSNDGMELEIRPRRNLSPWTVYHWNLGEKALSAEGAPLAKEAYASFVTDADRLLPEVLEAVPLMKAGAGLWWQRTGLALEDGLGPGQAVGICFNKPMDETAVRSIRFEPSLAGRYEWWTDSAAVFVPDRDPEPETVYTMIVSSDAKDRSGLKMEKDYRTFFIPDILRLSVISFETESVSVEAPENNGLFPVPVIEPDGILCVTLRFSHPFTVKAKTETVLALRLEPYFPGIIPQATFRSARWFSDDLLILEWEGAKAEQEEAHYYRLTLPGGRGGIEDGRGSYFKEDTFFFLEAVKR